MKLKVNKIGNKLCLYFSINYCRDILLDKSDIIEVHIKSNDKDIKFITKFNYNITIRNSIVKSLDLRVSDIVDVKIKRITSIQRAKDLFKNNKIDLLSLIPAKTSRNYDIIVDKFNKNSEKWLRIWYCHNRGSGRQIELKRFLDVEMFGSLLGQYQAEGTKNKNDKYAKWCLQFTNKLIDEHKEYLNYLSELGVNKENLEFTFKYNPKNIQKDKAYFYIDEFNNAINLPLKITLNNNMKGRGFVNTYCNVLLTEIILNSMNKIRKLLAYKRKYNILERKLVNSFFSKLLTGDGTLDIRVKNRQYNFPYTRIIIVDQDLEYLRDYKLIMNNLGFKAKINEKHISVRAGVSFDKLVHLYKIKAFRNTNNWNKLISVIEIYLKGRRLNTNYGFVDLKKYNSFTSMDIVNDYNVGGMGALDWLHNKEKEGFVERLKTTKSPINWILTDKALRFTDFVANWQNDLNKLKKERNIYNPDELLESLKTKFR